MRSLSLARQAVDKEPVAAILSRALLRSQSDERLLALVNQGQERAFEVIVERYRKPLERYCYRLLANGQSEDAVQQTFLGAWTALRAGADVRDPRAWLFRIAHNAALNTARQARHGHDELQESLPSTDDVPAELERP